MEQRDTEQDVVRSLESDSVEQRIPAGARMEPDSLPSGRQYTAHIPRRPTVHSLGVKSTDRVLSESST